MEVIGVGVDTKPDEGPPGEVVILLPFELHQRMYLHADLLRDGASRGWRSRCDD
jgi:hypothetical protein